jgi:hypothetical protein
MRSADTSCPEPDAQCESQSWDRNNQKGLAGLVWLASLLTTRPLRRTIATHFHRFPRAATTNCCPIGSFEASKKLAEREIHFDNEANPSALRHFAGQTTDPVELTLFVAFRSFIGLFSAPEAFAIVATHECDASMSWRAVDPVDPCALFTIDHEA